MLVRENIIANEALASLTDEQIIAIETLSKNDEDVVIGNRFGEVYRQMDATIKKATGIDRQGDEKTYLYLERAANEFAQKYNDYDALKGKIAELEAEIAKGGDSALKGQLESAMRELASTKEQYNSLKTTYDEAEISHKKALTDYKIDSEIARAREAIKLKSDLNEAVLNTLVASAIAKVKSKNPSFEVRDGKERLIFHDENGAPLNNAENKLNPFTAMELLAKEFEAMDILEKRQTKGAGGRQPNLSQNDILGATTQAEATEIINKMLFDRGISKTSLNFQSEFDKIWRENNVAKLPLK